MLDGPFPETNELIAGWFMIEVESEARAHEVAAYASSAPGQGGKPIYEWIEVRQIMSGPPPTDDTDTRGEVRVYFDRVAGGPKRREAGCIGNDSHQQGGTDLST